MMACSYLSAGGMKSEPTGAACWSPPTMAGCLTSEMRPIAPLTQPTPAMIPPGGPMGLQCLAELPSGMIGLPRAPIAQPSGSIPQPRRGLPSGQMLESGSVRLSQPIPPSGVVRPLGLPNRPFRPTGQSTGPILSNAQMELTAPFVRPLPIDLHGSFSQPESSTEPALDLSTSASSMTSSVKPRLPSPNEDE